MNDNNYQENAGNSCPRLVPVQFEFTHPTAITVSVAGTFNDWHPTSKSMQPSEKGRWLKEAFLPPGHHEYCLVVDGQWMPDPLAVETVPNQFGGLNSVLEVSNSLAAAYLARMENLPWENASRREGQS